MEEERKKEKRNETESPRGRMKRDQGRQGGRQGEAPLEGRWERRGSTGGGCGRQQGRRDPGSLGRESVGAATAPLRVPCAAGTPHSPLVGRPWAEGKTSFSLSSLPTESYTVGSRQVVGQWGEAAGQGSGLTQPPGAQDHLASGPRGRASGSQE